MLASEILAGIDIGSNAVRLIVNDIIAGKDYKSSMIKKTAYVRLPLRLGGDVFRYGYIRKTKEKQFIKSMQIFKDLIDFYGVSEYRAVATSAVRNAENSAEILQKIVEHTGISVEIIQGEQEAEILGRVLNSHLPDKQTYMSADLGGGSLDISIFRDSEILLSRSFKIGTVRIISGLADKKDFDEMLKFLKRIRKKYPDMRLVGSGGNINKISKMIGSDYLKHSQIKQIHNELQPLNIKERMLAFNLRYDRADVIVPAAEIYIKIMKTLKAKTMFVPKVGIGDAVIYKLFTERIF